MSRAALVILATSLCGTSTGCAGGRVRAGQGTEMLQEEEYAPEQKVKPPEGNVLKTSGPLTAPTPPPVLEVDLERRPKPPPRDIEPEPNTSPQPVP